MHMLQQIDHIGIAVKNLDETVAFYRQVMRLEVSSTEVFNGMKIAFLRIGDSELELLEDLTPDGAIARHVATRGEGIQHVAYRVDDIEQELQEMRAKGIELIDERPRPGARGARVAFLHPKSTKGVLIELVEPQGSPQP
jgi:methylmalonyl-CoA/ethylmalonyl-CoA epimerase